MKAKRSNAKRLEIVREQEAGLTRRVLIQAVSRVLQSSLGTVAITIYLLNKP